MRRFASLPLALSLLALAGCGQEPTAPLVPSEPLLARGAGSSAPSVSGHANLTVGGALQTMSFHARTLGDGSIDGVLQVKSRAESFGGRLHGRVECYIVAGNDAWIAGRVERDDIENFEADAFWLRVRDNGEGDTEPVDQTTDVLVWREGQRRPADLCAARYNLVLRPIEGGNIQVRP